MLDTMMQRQRGKGVLRDPKLCGFSSPIVLRIIFGEVYIAEVFRRLKRIMNAVLILKSPEQK